jgi:hypothetical protein
MSQIDPSKPHKQTDPETGSPAAVVFDEMVADFGLREGVAKYEAIARIEGDHLHPSTKEVYRGPYFFEPKQEAGYRPDLILANAPVEVRKAAAEILSTRQTPEEATATRRKTTDKTEGAQA